MEQRPHLRVAGPDDEPPTSAWPPFLVEWVLPYLKEPALFPVTVAVLGHLVIVLAPLMLAVWRVGSVFSALLLLVAAALSILPVRWEWLDEGRLRGVSAVVALVWVVSVATAWFVGNAGYL